MALQKLNLTELKIKKELDVLALIHPSQTCKILLNNPEFRKNLLDYVMRGIPNQYLLIESDEEFYEIKKHIKCTTAEKTLIYNLAFQRFNELRTRKKTAKSAPVQVIDNRITWIKLDEKNQFNI